MNKTNTYECDVERDVALECTLITKCFRNNKIVTQKNERSGKD